MPRSIATRNASEREWTSSLARAGGACTVGINVHAASLVARAAARPERQDRWTEGPMAMNFTGMSPPGRTRRTTDRLVRRRTAEVL